MVPAPVIFSAGFFPGTSGEGNPQHCRQCKWQALFSLQELIDFFFQVILCVYSLRLLMH